MMDRTHPDSAGLTPQRDRAIKSDREDRLTAPAPDTYTDHPLFDVFMGAIQQAMHGKGERHGGATIPFLKQQWVHKADVHGNGFLTGQAAKKLDEAAMRGEYDEAYFRELLGALNYIGMAILDAHKRGK